MLRVPQFPMDFSRLINRGHYSLFVKVKGAQALLALTWWTTVMRVAGDLQLGVVTKSSNLHLVTTNEHETILDKTISQFQINCISTTNPVEWHYEIDTWASPFISSLSKCFQEISSVISAHRNSIIDP